ncbi:MAG: DUF1080 domain-containing protein [Bacteroidales bacterium]|jgi:rhamnogalacturonan endolyase|nr:DUF1080 domain-containing protein [Bacteroidales bacterium]
MKQIILTLLFFCGYLPPSFSLQLPDEAGKPSVFDSTMFSNFWTIESDTSTHIRHLHDTLEISAINGVTLWWNQPLQGKVEITYKACVMDEGLPGDRLSDLNCFWMARDKEYPDDIFRRSKWRNGIFGRSYSLTLYYLGYGGNGNTTTRFRKYNGDFQAFSTGNTRPEILKEYTDDAHLLKANHWYSIRIVSNGKRIQYYSDDELIVDFTDEHPYTSGWFGFRTTKSRTRLTDFRIRQL